MKTLADLLKARIDELGFEDIKDFARAYQVPYELLRKVISNGHLPKDSTLLFYAKQFDMDPSDLLQAAYRQKAPEPVAHLFGVRALKRGLQAVTEGLRTAPVLGKAACGPWLESYSVEPDQFEPVELADPDAFFVVAEGESMIGGNILPGALLLVSPKAPVSNGQIVLARRGDEEFTVKKYFRKADGTVILQPMNPEFEPIIVTKDSPSTVMRITEVRMKV
jgi:SOS-response transcriptional repressor LexA